MAVPYERASFRPGRPNEQNMNRTDDDYSLKPLHDDGDDTMTESAPLLTHLWINIFFFPMAQHPPVGQDRLIFRSFTITFTHHSW